MNTAPNATVLIAHSFFRTFRAPLQAALLGSLALTAGWYLPAHATEPRNAGGEAAVETQIEPDLRPSFSRCMERAADVLPSRTRCIEAERIYQDQLLNLNYKKLMRILPAAQKNELRDDQRMWLTKRDRVCALVAPPGADPDQIVDSKYCVMQRTALQARELKLLLSMEKTGSK